MTTAIVEGEDGGIVVLSNAFMIGMDRIGFEGRNGPAVYEIEEGDAILFKVKRVARRAP